MDKRNLVKVVVAGTIASIMAGTGGKFVFAATEAEEMILYVNDMCIYSNRKDGETQEIRVIKHSYEDSRPTVWHMTSKVDERGVPRFHRLENETFDTIIEAYRYAKKLKAQYYG